MGTAHTGLADLPYRRARTGMAILDVELRVLEANAAMAELAGSAASALPGLALTDLLHPGDVSVDGLLAEVDGPTALRRRLRRADGATTWAAVTLSSFSREGAAFVLLEAHEIAARPGDVTERHQAERALERRSAELGEAQRLARLGSWSWRREDGQLTWTAELYRIWGQDPETFTLTPEAICACAHPDDADAVVGWWEAARRMGAPSDHVFRIVRPDGGVRVIRGRWEILRGASGAIEGFHGTAQDITEQHEAEAAAREDRALLDSILDNTSAAIYVKDLEGRFALVNPASAEALGRPAHEVLGRTNEELFGPAPSELVTADDRRILDEDRTLPVETAVPTSRGTRVFAGDKGPLRDAAGRTTGIFGILTDVTERKDAEERLARSERDLAEAHRIAGLGGWEWDADAGEVRFSEGLLRILGIGAGDVVGTPEWLLARVHPDDVGRLTAAGRGVVRDGVAAQIEHGWTVDGAEPLVLLTHFSAVETHPGIVGLRGTSQDVTALRTAETRITALLRQNELILGASREGIWGLDRDGRVILVNAAAAELLGWEAGELRGRSMHETVHHSRPDGSAYPREACPVDAAIVEGRALDLHTDVLWRADGTSVPVELSVNPVREDGVITGAVMSVRDITERQDVERQRDASHAALRALERDRSRLLRHLDRAQEEERRRIAADIHDDSVQAVSAVALRLELLSLRIADPEHRAALCELDATVGAALVRLRSLLFDLTPPGLEHGGLGAAGRAALEQLGEETGVTWTLADHTLLELSLERRTVAYRILQEGLANVRRHARARSVRVELADRDDGVHVLLADDGVGMDAEAAHRPRPGHLGLTSMRQRAELSGGWCAITGAPGEGSRVEFWIPREERPGVDAGEVVL